VLPTQSDWTRRGVFATRPALRETNPSNSTPPDPVRGRSEEAGEGKPLPFLGTQGLRRQLRLTYPASRGGDAYGGAATPPGKARSLTYSARETSPRTGRWAIVRPPPRFDEGTPRQR
jgi:hypothetical protein